MRGKFRAVRTAGGWSDLLRAVVGLPALETLQVRHGEVVAARGALLPREGWAGCDLRFLPVWAVLFLQ